MNQKHPKLMGILLFVFVQVGLLAQEAIPAAGGNGSGSGGSTIFSVGQVVYTTNYGTNGSESQGILQPYDISEVTGVEEAKEISLYFTAYPNPTTDFITLSIDNIEASSLSYQLFDMQGKLLQNKKITDNQTCIVMSNLAPAYYMVMVFQNNKNVKTFKVIKH